MAQTHTNALEQIIMEHLLNGVQPTAITPHLGLMTAATDIPAGTVTEVTGGSYARVALAALFPESPSDGTAAANNADIEFPQATASWGTITHMGIWSASTEGTLLAVITLDDSRAIDTDDIFRVLTGQLTLNLTAPA